MRSAGARRIGWQGWVVGVVGALAGGFAFGFATPAFATVSGNFCSNAWLSPGGTCHSSTFHTNFSRVDGNSYYNYATCVGIDQTRTGPNYVTQCSSSGVVCTTLCAGYSGYAYVHNHDTRGTDLFQGYLVAQS